MILYMILVIYFMINEFQSIWKLKFSYLKQFWSWIELGLIISSWMGVGIYIWRYQEFQRIGRLFQETNGYVSINFQFAAYVNDLHTYLLGFCCFFGILKLLRLCRYNRRLSLFTETLKYASKELLSFSMMFSIVFFAFTFLFYFLFISKIESCSSLSRTLRMIFEMTLLKFDTNELIQAAPFLGPFCFSLFIFLVVFVCMSMFISIISDTFRKVREHSHEDHRMFRFIFDKFCYWIGKYLL